MAPKSSKNTISDENKIEVICLADHIIDKCDELDTANARSLSLDYADDEPRKKVIRGLDDLHRGLYGVLTDRQHAQITFLLQQISDQERLDKENDRSKHGERAIVDEIKKTAKKLRNEYRNR